MRTHVLPPEEWKMRIPRPGPSGEGELAWEDATPFEVEMYGQKLRFPGGIAFSAKYDWHEGHVCVILSVRTEAEGECSKCLKPLRQEISGSLRYICLAGNSEKDSCGDSGEEEILVVNSLEKGLTLKEPLWETFLESLPRVLLCKEDCQGICPECGADRNENPCSCAAQRIDPRLASLKAMYFSEEKEGSNHGSSEKESIPHENGEA
ncbi:MAG TPA: DUF177 domain-containing protein [Synergistaceae bacterium]|nr:DUF177 domain-containing protein [Synergistaceae bacterium]HPJ25061.1 DUF177 domain-containing protein [Synergistaceae bacterium]HPQ38173.1 DUF177 domain-containing protein [Synergistaceae bacterium]